MLQTNILFFILVVLAVWASIKTKKLTIAGAVTGGVMAFVIYLGVGWFGLIMLGVFFLLGTLATAWQAGAKAKLGIGEMNSGRRSMWQVLANGGIAGLTGMLAIFFPKQINVWTIMMAGSLAAATADTLSSELGSVYGKRFYNCISFKKEPRGLDGVISIEGVLIGMAGSGVMGVIYSIGFGWNWAAIMILLAGTLGNLADSVLGATLERKGILNNNMVNLLNTLIGALTAAALATVSHLY